MRSGPLALPFVGLRQQVLSILHAVQADTWYSFERFCRLISELSRDPLSYGPSGAWCWTDGGKVLRAANMPFDVWMATYGRVLAALLRDLRAGSASSTSTARVRNCPRFRPLSAVPPGDLLSIPLTHSALCLRTQRSPQDLESRRSATILSRIAREVAPARDEPDRASTTYRLDARRFRAFLQAGGGADEPIRELAAATASRCPQQAPTD